MMDRREFMTSMVAAAGVPSIPSAVSGLREFAVGGGVAGTGNRRPKHVILMICDDLGYGDLGCYGGTIPTPNLDALAAGGIRFTHFNAAHPICSASRAALLTGRYAQRSHTIGAFFPNSKTGMALDETTLGNLFHNSGYSTKAIGKWHLGDAPEYLPTSRGFDSFYGVPYSVDMQPLPLMRDTSVLEPHTDRLLLTPRYTEEAVRFIDENSQRPFFLYVAYSYPHHPARPSPTFRGRSGFGEYGDTVHEIDASVGEIVHGLKSKGLLDDTLILFTGDHGPWWQGSPANLRGRKCSTFEGGFRVPLIAHWPGAITAGVTSNAWATNLDVLPTLVDLCQLKGSTNALDGVAVTPLLYGQKETTHQKAQLYFAPFSANDDDLHCARRGPWKARFAQLTGELYVNDYTMGHESYWLPNVELYNLARDPTESYDLATDNPKIVADILQDVEAQISSMLVQVQDAYARLKKNVAHITTPAAAAPRPPSDKPLPKWMYVAPNERPPQPEYIPE
jgi:arylsulfatase A